MIQNAQQGLTAAWLTSVAVSLSRAQGFRSLLDRAHGHICRCSEHLRSKSDPADKELVI